MAFNLQGLQRLGGGLSINSVAQWTYASPDDAIGAIGAADYFLPAIRILKLGDLVNVVDSSGAASDHVVSVNDGTTIEVAART